MKVLQRVSAICLLSAVFQHVASAQTISSLKPGTYVRIGVGCKDPANAFVMRFDGTRFMGGRACGIPENRESSTTLKPCGGGNVDTIEGTVSMLAAEAFRLKNGAGTFEFRYCSDAELRGISAPVKRFSQPPQVSQAQPTISNDLSGLDSETRQVVAQVLAQREIKVIGYSGWENLTGPFSLIGATRQDKTVNVFVRSPKNEWGKVDCALLEGGGSICFMGTLIYSGFFSK